jgi:hypothetical protein
LNINYLFGPDFHVPIEHEQSGGFMDRDHGRGDPKRRLCLEMVEVSEERENKVVQA